MKKQAFLYTVLIPSIVICLFVLSYSFSAPKKQCFVVKTDPALVEAYTKKYFAMDCELVSVFPVETDGYWTSHSGNGQLHHINSKVNQVMLIFEK